MTVVARIILTCLGSCATAVLILLVLFTTTKNCFWMSPLSYLMADSDLRIQNRSGRIEGYSGIGTASYPWYLHTEIDQAYLSKNDSRSHNIVISQFGNKEKELFSFTGVNSLTEKCYRNHLICLLSDEEEKYRLVGRSMPGGFGETRLLSLRSEKAWKRQTDSAYPYLENGYFHAGETPEGYEVLMEVGDEISKGFLKLEYVYEEHKLYRFMYLESNEVYDEARAKDTIASVTGVKNEIRFKQDVLILETDDMPAQMGVDLFLEGAPYDLMCISWQTAGLHNTKIGKYVTKLEMNGQEQEYEVIIQDTKAPVPCESDAVFFVGDMIQAEWLAANCFEDFSLPVTVQFTDGSETYQIPDKAFENNEMFLSVQATDSLGNSAEREVCLKLYEYSDLPEWYRFFIDPDDTELQERIRKGELDDIKEEFFGEGRCEDMEASLESAINGYKKGIRCDLQVHLDGPNWYGHELVAFYDAINLLPDSVLEAFAENNWSFELRDTELWLDEMECAGITYYADNEIEITSKFSDYEELRATSLHEIGHFFDWDSAFIVSFDEETEAIRYQIAEKFGYSEAELLEWRLNGCGEDPFYYRYLEGGYRKYSLVYSEEFVADSFYFFCAHPEKMQREYPLIYQKIDELS